MCMRRLNDCQSAVIVISDWWTHLLGILACIRHALLLIGHDQVYVRLVRCSFDVLQHSAHIITRLPALIHNGMYSTGGPFKNEKN